MAKLNQIVAVEKGIKSKVYNDITKIHQKLQKTALLFGISRSYQPRSDDGETLPPESQAVQVKADEEIEDFSEALIKLFDITATKDWANTSASANIVVDGEVILSDVPITFLLFLEKQLTDIHTFIAKLPTLDPGETWSYDNARDCYATQPIKTTRTKKIPRNHVKAEATDKHPAQVEMWYEDVVVGDWSTTKYSGALPVKRVNELLAKVEKLQHAVKFAREQANSIDAPRRNVGETIFDWIFD